MRSGNQRPLLGFLGAYLGGLLDMWVHHFGQLGGVDRVLVDGVPAARAATPS